MEYILINNKQKYIQLIDSIINNKHTNLYVYIGFIGKIDLINTINFYDQNRDFYLILSQRPFINIYLTNLYNKKCYILLLSIIDNLRYIIIPSLNEIGLDMIKLINLCCDGSPNQDYWENWPLDRKKYIEEFCKKYNHEYLETILYMNILTLHTDYIRQYKFRHSKEKS